MTDLKKRNPSVKTLVFFSLLRIRRWRNRLIGGVFYSFSIDIVQSWGADTDTLKGFLMEDDPDAILSELR